MYDPREYERGLASREAGVSLVFRWAALALAAVIAFAAPAQAQRATVQVPGGTIASVQIQGNVRSETETIRSYLQLKEGQAYDPAAADRSLKALFSTGLYSDVTIDMQGSTLVVRVTENPIINRVAFEGNRKIEDDKLRDEVQSKARQVFTRARVQADVERILTIYRRSGRYNAVVEPMTYQGAQLWRVMLGPVSDASTAEGLRDEAAGAGYADARVISPF